MNKYLLLFAVITTFCAAAFGQKPTPTPADDDVVKISTNLIQVDVTVTDKKGKVITDLKPEEVQIFENGQRQQITNFSFVSSVRTVEKPAETAKNGVPVPPTTLKPDQVRRTFALVVDDLSLSFDSAYYTRRALKKFVDEQIQPGDLVAIIRTGAGIGALQQFTSDKRILYAAIEKVKWNPQGTGGISAFAPIQATPDTSLQTDAEATDDTETAAGGAGQSLDDFRSTMFATGTLGAIRYVVTGMAELPGRKSVILFSHGFKLFETDESGFQSTSPVLDYLKQLIDLANRSSVVFYAIDPRGLAVTGFTAEDNISDTSPDAMNTQARSRREELQDTQDGLRFLAKETGGFAVVNSNDLSGGVRRVMEDQSYYLVAYEPDSDTFDAAKRKFNALTVKVTRPGATVRYRSGFFNVADKASSPATVTPESARSPVVQLQNALVSPFAVSGIDLRLNALFGNDEKAGSFVRSLLHIDAKDLKFTDDKDGSKKAVFDILAMSFGDNGQITGEQIAKTYTLTLKGETLKKVMAEGFVYHFTFPVKKPGAYQYRVAIRDVQGGKLGSASQFIEVPDLKKSGLTLSSIVLGSVALDDYRRETGPDASRAVADPLADTALRRIKVGSALSYAYQIYNAKLSSAKTPQLTVRVRVFRDGEVVFDGKERAYNATGQADLQHLRVAGAISIGDKLPPGDYILQVIVTDPLASPKRRVATQFVQFEVVE